MKILELFSGTQSISNVFRAHGWETYTIDNNPVFKDITTFCGDMREITPEFIFDNFGQPNVIWASPPCTTYSIAAISHHRMKEANGNLLPKSEFAKISDELLEHTKYLIERLRPELWFIENPVGGMRKVDIMQMLPRYTITYCQYGDNRRKPTDIWTNCKDPQFKPMCKNGAPCHVSAPRGSKTGTQGLKNSIERARIPVEFCEHIYALCKDLK